MNTVTTYLCASDPKSVARRSTALFLSLRKFDLAKGKTLVFFEMVLEFASEVHSFVQEES